MTRIALLLATNIAVVLVLSIILNLLGVEQFLREHGIDAELVTLLIFAAGIGFAGSFISLAMSKYMAMKMMGAQPIESPRGEQEQWLVETVRRFAQREGIGMPDVAIYDAPEINAFATGARRNSALVAVSSGLLQNMTRDEAEAVIAHEVAHVSNGDMVTLTLIQGVVNTFVIFLSHVAGRFVDRVVFKNEDGHGPGFWITMIFAQMVLGVLASMITMYFSRKREFRADAGSAKLAGRDKMIAALEKLKRSVEPQNMPDEMEAFGINGRMGGSSIKRLFMSHPPLDERIEALKARPV
ncbi:MAG: protease HtpX [Halorhodospira halophila]|uniref:protease HtpX n=1 Tax=Halorhodospira TaxID=85108 RepID=UPI001911CFDE|nr:MULTISPECIES: protease HtpX [Halorhodospira]MBK5936575.1 zinc metalloprotease HtpX [Halorhodospira halophila]MCC3750083.1 protease HtpX [Halorhodospira halophila]MCG5527587.1 protease HtpX [Halorhodospira halophila]MCG5532606.1 protease HtpX [Halorhodospira sp. 9621]MCG5539000.1 protease HtpX [Halorhodospira sp. 9622]